MAARMSLVFGFMGLWFWVLSPQAMAQTSLVSPAVSAAEGKAAERSVRDWLMRMHAASQRRAYLGTFVVTAGGSMSSARIWHVCDGEQQMERIESLTGAQRSTFRRNEQVMTYLPESRVAVSERRDSLGLFPNLLQSNDSSIVRFYRVKMAGSERVAGFAADVVNLQPIDTLRFAYRVWTEKKNRAGGQVANPGCGGPRAGAIGLFRIAVGCPRQHGQAASNDGQHRGLPR